MNQSKKICLIAVYDSYLKNVIPLVKFLSHQGYNIELLISDLISERMATELMQGQVYRQNTIMDLRNGNFDKSADVFFIGAGGNDLVKISGALQITQAVLVSMFPGITGGKIFQGFNDRANTDIILLNNFADIEKYQNYAADFKLAPRPYMLGYTSLEHIQNQGGDDIIFFEQNFPNMKHSQKTYIFEMLVKIACARPKQRVIIKMRSKPGEQTPHHAKFSLEALFRRAKKKHSLPANLQLSYVALPEVLRSANLCISVSSAACLEALYNDINCVILSEFGMSEELGNVFFSGSNLFADFFQILKGDIPTVSSQWSAQHICAAEANYSGLLELLASCSKVTRNKSQKPRIINAVISQKKIYGGVELQKEILQRKYKKFRQSPRLFFTDSNNSVVRLCSKLTSHTP